MPSTSCYRAAMLLDEVISNTYENTYGNLLGYDTIDLTLKMLMSRSKYALRLTIQEDN